jgi:hypothetical protein
MCVWAGRYTFALALGLVSATGAPCQAQVAPNPLHRIPRDSGSVLASPFWSRPLTVLDYFLMEVHSRLDEQANFWADSAPSGLWASTWPHQASVKSIAILDPRSGDVVFGLSVTADRFTKPPREVCTSLIESVTMAVPADEVTRRYPLARHNMFSHLMPRSIFAVSTEQERDVAYDAILQRTALVVELLALSTRQSYECSRQALADTVSVRETSVPR